MGEPRLATLNPALEDFWRTQSRWKILHGGRVSSKSWDAAGWATFLTSQMKLKFLCCRQHQNRIEESVYSLLKVQINRFGYSGFEILKNKIINHETGSEFLFYGLWRNIEEIKSIEGVDILWIEEAHSVNKTQMDILEPTIRKEDSEIWLTFNARLASDYVWQNFVVHPRKNSVIRKINYDENPFLSNTMRETIEELKMADPDSYEHIYGGNPLANDENSIIQRKWIEAAIDAHTKIPVTGISAIGFDVADDGKDKNGEIKLINGVIRKVDQWAGGMDGVLDSSKRVYVDARSEGLPIIYDPIGVGAACGAKFGELNEEFKAKVHYTGFVAGDSVIDGDYLYANGIKNKDMFLNLKAQAWWLMADRFRDTYNYVVHGIKSTNLISIDSSVEFLDQLIDELSTPRRRFAENGKMKAESKEELAKRGVASPNLADAVIMAHHQGKRAGAFSDLMSQSGGTISSSTTAWRT